MDVYGIWFYDVYIYIYTIHYMYKLTVSLQVIFISYKAPPLVSTA